MSRKAKRAAAPSRRDECGALPEPKQAETEKKHRKPVFTLPPEKVVEQCLKDERDLICAGQVLAVQN